VGAWDTGLGARRKLVPESPGAKGGRRHRAPRSSAAFDAVRRAVAIRCPPPRL